MRVGVPRELKNNEYRVAITPAGVHELVRHGHEVLIEEGAGAGSSIPDEEYIGAGAKILEGADDVWADGDLILKVKEPIAEEYHRMRSGQTLFTYLHLAASRECTRALLDSGITSVAYETVQLPDRSLPLLAPMSEVAGRLAPQVGAYNLMMGVNGNRGHDEGEVPSERNGRPRPSAERVRSRARGRGVLPGGVPGVAPGRVVVIGGGVSGLSAAQIAVGMGADVTIMDVDIDRLRKIDAIYQGRVRTLASNAYAIERAVLAADLVIGAVLIPGAKAPTLVSDQLVARMRPGAVLVDIAIDQGGCFENSHPTTHDDPTYPVHGAIFYCVANMPGSVPNTSTYALTNVTLPYAVALAEKGWCRAAREDRALALGLSTHEGGLLSAPVAEAHGLEATELDDVLT